MWPSTRSNQTATERELLASLGVLTKPTQRITAAPALDPRDVSLGRPSLHAATTATPSASAAAPLRKQKQRPQGRSEGRHRVAGKAAKAKAKAATPNFPYGPPPEVSPQLQSHVARLRQDIQSLATTNGQPQRMPQRPLPLLLHPSSPSYEALPSPSPSPGKQRSFLQPAPSPPPLPPQPSSLPSSTSPPFSVPSPGKRVRFHDGASTPSAAAAAAAAVPLSPPSLPKAPSFALQVQQQLELINPTPPNDGAKGNNASHSPSSTASASHSDIRVPEDPERHLYYFFSLHSCAIPYQVFYKHLGWSLIKDWDLNLWAPYVTDSLLLTLAACVPHARACETLNLKECGSVSPLGLFLLLPFLPRLHALNADSCEGIGVGLFQSLASKADLQVLKALPIWTIARRIGPRPSGKELLQLPELAPLRSTAVAEAMQGAAASTAATTLQRSAEEEEKAVDVYFQAPLPGKGPVLKPLKRLRQLNVAKTAINDEGVKVIIDTVPQLTGLSLSGCDITDHAVARLFFRMPGLEDLDISHCPRVSDKPFYELMFLTGKIPRVSTSWAVRAELYESRREGLALTAINISHCIGISGEGLAFLLLVCTRLLIPYPHCQRLLCHFPAFLSPQNTPKMRRFYASHTTCVNDLAFRTLFERDVTWGTKSMKGLPWLEELDLSHCEDFTTIGIKWCVSLRRRNAIPC